MSGTNIIKRLLTHPMARDLDINDPYSSYLQGCIAYSKPLLRKIYEQWYKDLALCVPNGNGGILEIGSGGGFSKKYIPDVISSDVFVCPNLDVVLDACCMPFVDSGLKAIVMTDVFHHMPDPRLLLKEAARCVRPGGVMVMIEPWITSWSRFVYGRFHHEPFDPDSMTWEFTATGPLAGANLALPWIMFCRDRSTFNSEVTEWSVLSITLGFPFRYLLSGGVSLRAMMPAWSDGIWRRVEAALEPWMSWLAMFAQIVLVRK